MLGKDALKKMRLGNIPKLPSIPDDVLKDDKPATQCMTCGRFVYKSDAYFCVRDPCPINVKTRL